MARFDFAPRILAALAAMMLACGPVSAQVPVPVASAVADETTLVASVPEAQPQVPVAQPPAPAARRQVRRATLPSPRVTALSADPQPTYGPTTIEVTRQALERYRTIAARGGWPATPVGTRLAVGAQGPAVIALKQRLAIEGDIDPAQVANSRFDQVTQEAVRSFQRRVGLLPSGVVAGATVTQLNISIDQRVTALAKSLERLTDSRFTFGQRYVIVNIPAAAAEAIENGVVKRRHVVIVGKPDRPSPMVETRLTVVNFNPTWTIPTSIIRRDIIPRMQRNPNTLAQMRVRVLDGRGNEVNPTSINWNSGHAVNFTLRQDPGAGNSLGRVRIDMPNREAVFMHDTPSRRLFLSDARFFSSGCVRVADVNDFVTWLLEPQGWTRSMVDEHMRQTERKDVRLRQAVPVAWVYLTGWAAPDGTVQFREDVYGVDAPGAMAFRVVRPAERPPAQPVQIAPAAPPPPQPTLGLFGIFGVQQTEPVYRD